MALKPAELRCDECDRAFESEWDEMAVSAERLRKEATSFDLSAKYRWSRVGKGIFCPRCIAKAMRPTLVVEMATSGKGA